MKLKYDEIARWNPLAGDDENHGLSVVAFHVGKRLRSEPQQVHIPVLVILLRLGLCFSLQFQQGGLGTVVPAPTVPRFSWSAQPNSPALRRLAPPSISHTCRCLLGPRQLGVTGALNGRCGEQRANPPPWRRLQLGLCHVFFPETMQQKAQASILFVAGRNIDRIVSSVSHAHRAVTYRCHPLLPHGCYARTVATLSPLLRSPGTRPNPASQDTGCCR